MLNNFGYQQKQQELGVTEKADTFGNGNKSKHKHG